jgi:hypothetical protein
MPSRRSRTILVLPAVLLTVNLLEIVASYKVRQHVRDVPTRVAISLVLVGVAFAAGADWISPWLARVLTETRKGSHRHAGTVGLVLFYIAIYGALWWAYYLVERRGASGLLPSWLR